MELLNNTNPKWFWELLKESYLDLKENDPLRLSSSTSFFASFSLIPIIVLLLDLAGTVIEVKLLKDEIFKTLQRMFGESTTDHLNTILSNVQNMQQGPMLTIGMLIFLAFIATTLFDVIHNSFNQILQVKLKDHTSIPFYLKNRGLFFLIIMAGGCLFVSTFLVDVALSYVFNDLFHLPNINPVVLRILDILFSSAMFTTWLAIVYKYLPDIKLPWKAVWLGSFFTMIMFLIGQFILGRIMSVSNLNNIYGTSASMVLLLLFIFYSSFILYYGFCLVKKFAEKSNFTFESTQFAVRYEIRELE